MSVGPSPSRWLRGTGLLPANAAHVAPGSVIDMS
jgi:hypothetical protein